MKRLAILGASGHGKVVADIAECCGWDEIIFFDDAWPTVVKNGAWTVIGNSVSLQEQLSHFQGFFVAIGHNAIRMEKLAWLSALKAPVISLVHTSATVSRYADIGMGCVVMPGATVNAYAQIADGVILNTGCNVDHDCQVDAGVHISPGASIAGGGKIGQQSWIGIGASVKQLVKVGERVTVGAGAAVVSDLADGVMAVGVPAKVV